MNFILRGFTWQEYVWKHVNQFTFGFWLVIVTDRPCHLSTLTLRDLSYKLRTSEVIFQGPFGLLYHESYLWQLSSAEEMRFISTQSLLRMYMFQGSTQVALHLLFKAF